MPKLKLPTLYLVVADFGQYGIGSGDVKQDRGAAFDAYADHIDQGEPTRVFVLEFCVSTNALEIAREVTDEMAEELSDLAAKIGEAA